MDNVYATSEMYGSSGKTIEDAIQKAAKIVAGRVRNPDWFEVREIRGHIKEDGSIGHSQVGVKLGFRCEPKD